jgi:VWFA-related protein
MTAKMIRYARRRARPLLLTALCLATNLLLFAQQTTAPAPDSQPTVFKSNVRRVVVDVVVTDSTGKTVPGLTKEDFSVAEDGRPQQLLFFIPNGFQSGMDYLPPKLPPEPPNTFVNLPATPERGPLYVLLYDLVNMDNEDQMALNANQHSDQIISRQQLVKFIKNKPEGTRFAIFVWSDGLHMLQGFTSDKDLLMIAINPNSSRPHIPEVFSMGQNFGRGDPYAAIGVMRSLATYLDGLPGRKNLIWFSGEFPLSLFPSDENVPSYAEQVKTTLDLLARDQIAIYPVDIRGVVTADWHGATEAPGGAAGGGTTPADIIADPGAPSGAEPQPSSQTTASKTAGAGGGKSLLASSLMVEDEIARITGGRAFYGTNDAATALYNATETGSSYYTLIYSPTNQNYNGRLRGIEVELSKKGYHLAYRRAYYGSDFESTASADKSKGSVTPTPPGNGTLDASMEHGAPEAHQLIFGAHVHTVGASAKGTPEQMAQLSTQPAFSKGQHKGGTGKPLAPIQLQKYAIDYTVMSHQLAISGQPLHLEIAAAAYDSDGKMLNAVVNNSAEDAAASPIDPAKRPRSYRIQQEMDVPLSAKFIRLAVRDANTERVGAMEINLPLQAETQAQTTAPPGSDHP